MRLLLDTHCFLWFISGSRRLSVPARLLIEDAHNRSFLSVASLWEMAIKISLGRLSPSRPFETLIPDQLRLNGIEVLGITVEHTTVVATLPFHHRDPFGRLLASQEMVEQMPIVSIDPALDAYDVTRLW